MDYVEEWFYFFSGSVAFSKRMIELIEIQDNAEINELIKEMIGKSKDGKYIEAYLIYENIVNRLRENPHFIS